MAETEFQRITVGRRKTAVARVFLRPGSGAFKINGKALPEYFKTINTQLRVQEPLRVVELADKYDVFANVNGGGITGQSDSIALGISRFLVELNPNYRDALKKKNLLTRDPRAKERKKYGQKRARKKFQFSKR
ncbi:30S ribosomal protein S9 [bacterium]|nr:30S ribosomal protein S9 [bacterium]